MDNLFDDDNDVLKELEKQRLIEAEVTKLTFLNKSDKYSGIRYILNEQNPQDHTESGFLKKKIRELYEEIEQLNIKNVNLVQTKKIGDNNKNESSEELHNIIKKLKEEKDKYVKEEKKRLDKHAKDVQSAAIQLEKNIREKVSKEYEDKLKSQIEEINKDKKNIEEIKEKLNSEKEKINYEKKSIETEKKTNNDNINTLIQKIKSREDTKISSKNIEQISNNVEKNSNINNLIEKIKDRENNNTKSSNSLTTTLSSNNSVDTTTSVSSTSHVATTATTATASIVNNVSNNIDPNLKLCYVKRKIHLKNDDNKNNIKTSTPAKPVSSKPVSRSTKPEPTSVSKSQPKICYVKRETTPIISRKNRQFKK